MKEYQKHIISTPENQVWLHRTTKDLVDKILKNGLNFGTDLSGTATAQPRKLEDAEGQYKAGKDFGSAVIVIKIPKEIVRRYYLQSRGLKGPGHEGYKADKEVTYYDDGFIIQRKHIHGWIDRETNEYQENPYKDKPQELTDKYFPPMFYGGLERDLLTPEEPVNLATPKRKKLKAEKLPPPPSEIKIID